MINDNKCHLYCDVALVAVRVHTFLATETFLLDQHRERFNDISTPEVTEKIKLVLEVQLTNNGCIKSGGENYEKPIKVL